MESFADYGISLPSRATGNAKTTCPKCSPGRKNKTDPCLSVEVEKGVWRCHHCEWEGGLRTIRREDFHRKAYQKPQEPKAQTLSQTGIDWFTKRGITPEVWTRNKIYSAKVWLPQTQKEESCVNFPYYRDGELVNIKHRDGKKNFTQEKDAEQILFGYDDIEDSCLVWVEGEMDKLSAEVAGFKSCVSVPAGAPGEKDRTDGKKFQFFDSAKERLDKVKLHVIAVDNDGPGFRLQQELIRRLGAENCSVAVWPDGCKDANDVLVKHGAEELFKRITSAKPCPIKGIITVEDVSNDVFSLYEHGSGPGLSTGWSDVDEFYTVRPGEWTAVTGIPGHGKSEFIDALLMNLSYQYGWKFALFSPENQPIAEHVKKLLEKCVDKPFGAGPKERISPEELLAGMGWLNDRFCFVVPENPTVEEIISIGKKMVRRYGINGIVIDPWNEIDHHRPSSMTETEYISHALSQFRRFARECQIHLWLVAHPTKLQKDKVTNKYPVPTLYDISGSAHWRNKADNGITVFRHIGEDDFPVEIHVQKIRFKAVGKVGTAKLRYDRITGRYKGMSEYFSGSYVEVGR